MCIACTEIVVIGDLMANGWIIELAVVEVDHRKGYYAGIYFCDAG